MDSADSHSTHSVHSKHRGDNKPVEPESLCPIELDANQELIAFAVSNLIGCFFGAYVCSGSFSRSGLNYEMGGHTQISTLIQAILCLFCLSFLMPLLAPLPNAVLASVVAISVHRLIANGISEITFLWNVSRIELFEFMTALIAPLVVGLEIGIFIAIGCSILVHLLRHSFAKMVYLGRCETTGQSVNQKFVPLQCFEGAHKVEGVVILEMESEISFSNSRTLVDGIRTLLTEGQRFVILEGDVMIRE